MREDELMGILALVLIFFGIMLDNWMLGCFGLIYGLYTHLIQNYELKPKEKNK